MAGIASLPMYPAPIWALESFWRCVRAHLEREGLADTPEHLSVPGDLEAHWRAPDLLLSQTCGYPLTTSLAGQVAYVGTPVYAAPGCAGPFYRSVLIVREGDRAENLAALRGRRVAFNSRDSQSGNNALRAMVAPLAGRGSFFSVASETGAHRASLAAVRGGRADLAAIDAVTFALLARDHPDEVAGVRILGVTPLAPGLPFITSRRTDREDLDRLRRALAAACSDSRVREARRGLLLDGFEVLPPSAYAAIPRLRDRAVALGYSDLA